MSEPRTEPPVVRPFADILREMRYGTLHDELGEQLADIVDAVVATGKAGKLVVTITVKPGPARGTVLLIDDEKTTIPRDVEASIFFARGGRLSRRDPDQPELWEGPKAVQTRDGKPVNVTTGEIAETGAGA